MTRRSVVRVVGFVIGVAVMSVLALMFVGVALVSLVSTPLAERWDRWACRRADWFVARLDAVERWAR